MTRQRRSVDPSFKLEAVKMIKEQGLSVQHVSESMSIGPTAIRRRVEQSDAGQSGRPGIGKPLTPEQQRIRQLEQENRPLRGDVEILNKAAVVFEGIVYVLHTGCQWKALPKERVGRTSALHARFLEWERRLFRGIMASRVGAI
jgi:transposase